jgi:hypothetical protein
VINVEFRIAKTEDRDDDMALARVLLPVVPEVGELVNIDGDPFRVLERAWAFTVAANDNNQIQAPHDGLWCYVRVR